MPWCDECDELVDTDDMTEDGECPTCGSVLVEEVGKPVPWYFKAMIVASIIYLGYRTFQGITWVVHHA